MWDGFLADFRKGDYAHMASFFAENAIYMPAGRETINGRQGVERFWHAAHEQGVRDFKVNVERVETLGIMPTKLATPSFRFAKLPTPKKLLTPSDT